MSSQSSRLTAMRQGGRVLAGIRDELMTLTKPGMTFAEIEALAVTKIQASGMQESFSTVPGYPYATCVMKNDALCHGIPDSSVVLDGDLITIDIGLKNQGYHLDTSVSFVVGKASVAVRQFLASGQKALNSALAQVKAGASVYAVSYAMQEVVEKDGYGAVYQLTGHGIGSELHEKPAIPCVAQKRDKQILLTEGQTIAVEIMYTMGSPQLKLDGDGWTFRTVDGSLSAMFEDTVAVTAKGCEVLTKG